MDQNLASKMGLAGGIIGLITAPFTKKNPKPAGAIMLICGLLGLTFGLGFWIGALLLITASMILFIGKKELNQT